MNNNMNHTTASHKGLLFGGMMATAILISLLGVQYASAAISRSLDLGSTGSDVTELQTYLAKDANLYPSGLVTGFFGPLTEAGVQRFQSAQGIVTNGTPASTGYGRVGPSTMARLNALMGGYSQSYPGVSPSLSATAVQVTNTTATYSFNTNEPTQGQVYWDTTPLRSDEATGPRQLPFVSGTLALDAGGLQTYHTVTVSNLQPNTTYYFLTRGVDVDGNMSMTLPSFFRTNP